MKAILLAYFEPGSGYDPSGRELLPAVGAVPGVRSHWGLDRLDNPGGCVPFADGGVPDDRANCTDTDPASPTFGQSTRKYYVAPEKPPDHIHCKASSALSMCWNCQFSLRYVLVSGSFRPCVHAVLPPSSCLPMSCFVRVWRTRSTCAIHWSS